MRRVLVRRSTAAVGIYLSVGLGVLGTIAATRELHSAQRFGDYATVLFAVGLLQGFFDVTVEEAVVKYGFRYVARENWPRLSKLLRVAAILKILGGVLGGVGLLVFAAFGPHRLRLALLIGALLPLMQSLDGLAGTLLYLRGRYDIRSGLLSWSMLLRFAGIAIGAHFGVTQAIAGILMAQAVATGSSAVAAVAAFRRFPRSAVGSLDDDRREIRSFMVTSTIASGVTSLRTSLGPLLLGAVTTTVQVGLFRVAQAPQSAFQTLSAPARMVLLTEQTRDWEKGNQRAVLRGIRNYSLLAAVVSAALAPPLYIYIPALIRHINGPEYVGASNAARLFVVAAAVQFVVGWTKSFPVTIGRPELRLQTHTLEAVVTLPLIVLLGAYWGATGAAAAVLIGIVLFCITWVVIAARIEPQDGPTPSASAFDEEIAAEEEDAGALIQ